MLRLPHSKQLELVLLLTWLGFTRPAQAEAPKLVELSAPDAGCPSEDYLNGRVLRLIGEDASERGSASVIVRKTEDGYAVSLSIQSAAGTGERHFDAASCRLGVDTAALIVVISLYPDRAAE